MEDDAVEGKEDESSDLKAEDNDNVDYDDIDEDNKNILSDSADNSLDTYSQIEEVIIEKEVKNQAPPEDISEVKRNLFKFSILFIVRFFADNN